MKYIKVKHTVDKFLDIRATKEQRYFALDLLKDKGVTATYYSYSKVDTLNYKP